MTTIIRRNYVISTYNNKASSGPLYKSGFGPIGFDNNNDLNSLLPDALVPCKILKNITSIIITIAFAHNICINYPF